MSEPPSGVAGSDGASQRVSSQPNEEADQRGRDPQAVPGDPECRVGQPEIARRTAPQQIDDAVEVRMQIWREAAHKDNPHGCISLADESGMRRHLYELCAAEAGIPLRVPAQRSVQTLKRFLEQSLPPKEPIIEGLLHRRDIVALAGRRRHGKTTFAGNLVLALGLGHSDFLGYPIPGPARALAFYLEDDAGELQIKLRRMCRGAVPEDRLAVYTREDFHRANIPIDVTHDNFQRFVVETCSAHHPDLIILDNLAHLIGADYNNSKLIHKLNQFAWQIASAFNAAIIISAHPRKRDKQVKALGFNSRVRLRDDTEGFFEEVMGSSHFVNSCGSLWGIERDLDSGRTDFLGGSQRFDGQQSLMALEQDEDGWLRRISDFEVNLEMALNTPARKAAWELLPAGPFSYTDAERTVKPAMKSASTFHAWLQLCVRLGLVIRDGDGYRKAGPAESGTGSR